MPKSGSDDEHGNGLFIARIPNVCLAMGSYLDLELVRAARLQCWAGLRLSSLRRSSTSEARRVLLGVGVSVHGTCTRAWASSQGHLHDPGMAWGLASMIVRVRDAWATMCN